MNHGNNIQGDYTLVGEDLAALWLQPGFVEGVEADRRHFATLVDAYRHIFRRNQEFAILLWNGLPVRINYQDDLPAMLISLIDLLDHVQSSEAQICLSYEFKTPNLRFEWSVETGGDTVSIESRWTEVPGHYEAALNRLSMMSMPRKTFLCEWKLLLKQFVQAMTDAEAVLTDSEARNQFQILKDIEASIPSRGRFYQY